jgi:hypothetical protein
LFNIRDVTNPAVVPQLAKFPSPAFQRNDSDLKRNERKLLILEQLRVLRRPEGEVPEVIALRMHRASPCTNPLSSPPVKRLTPKIAHISAGHVNHGTFWPDAPAKSGTLKTVNVDVSAPSWCLPAQ